MTEYADHAWTERNSDAGELVLGLRESGALVAQTVLGDHDTQEVALDRDQVLDLYHRLGDHLVATDPRCVPDATADGYDWPTGVENLPTGLPQTVLEQAQEAVYGDREADYGHPREDFTRQAILYTGLLQHKLAEGAYVEAEDIARLMIATKLARDVHSPKRDNRVDGAGYFLTLDRLATGK